MFAPLPHNWMQWVADNRLRDCSPADMVETMVQAGLDRASCVHALKQLEANPVYLAARKQQQLARKLESVLANQQKLWESAPDYTVVERRESVGVDEFFSRYARGSRPLVLTGLARDWPALQRWSPRQLKARFGAHEVEIQSGRSTDPHFEQNKLLHRQRVRFGDFLDAVESGGPSNDSYLTANNELLRRPEFASLLDDVGPLPEYCDPARFAELSYLWVGPAGTRTPLHHDTVMLLHTQVVGCKRWRLVSPLQTARLYNHQGMFSPVDLDTPDPVRFPAAEGLQVLDLTLAPGETLFLPLGWWHQVAALQASVSLSFSCLACDNDFRYADPAITDW